MAGAVLLLWVTVICSGINGVRAQDGSHSTKGKSFTLAFFPEYTSAPTSALRNSLYLASAHNGTCTLRYHDGARRTAQIQLAAHQVIEKPLPDWTQMTNIGTGVEPRAIYVSCDVDISLYGFNKIADYTDSSDSFIVLPDTILSNEYMVASIDKTAFIGVVAKNGNTKVSIHLKSTCTYTFNSVTYGSGDTLNVTLAENDVFRLGATGFKSPYQDCDLGGTEIKSSDDVAVFSGAHFYYDGAQNWRHMVHQTPPLFAFTQTILIPAMKESLNGKMVVRIIASQHAYINTTSETKTGSVSRKQYTLNRGQVLDLNYTPGTNVVLQSSAPIMAIQNILTDGEASNSLFIPGVIQYDKDFLISSFVMDSINHAPTVSIVTETASIGDVRVNGGYPGGIVWTNLSTMPYSVGSLTIQRKVSYNITSTTSLLVRVYEEDEDESYSYIAGFKIPDSVKNALNLDCLPGGWFVSLDLSKLHPRPSDISQIYLTKDSCTGSLQGDLLVFNRTYSDCHTTATVSNETLIYKNSLLYAPLSKNHVIRQVKWLHDLRCTMATEGTDSVHIYPDVNTTGHTETTGVIQGSTVHISLYKEASYQHPIEGSVVKAKIGQPVYVQVSAPGSQFLVMVVHSCDAHLEDNKHVSYPLIENGCTVDSRTQILVSRNQITRFQFEMIDLQQEQDGIYVTCHVTFCDPMDFSARCQQRCHTDPHAGIVG